MKEKLEIIDVEYRIIGQTKKVNRYETIKLTLLYSIAFILLACVMINFVDLHFNFIRIIVDSVFLYLGLTKIYQAIKNPKIKYGTMVLYGAAMILLINRF